MKVCKQLTSLILLLTVMTAVFPARTKAQAGESASSLAAKTRRFAPTVMTANTTRLPPNDRRALQKIIAAAKLYDPLYLRQIWRGNESLLKQLERTRRRSAGCDCTTSRSTRDRGRNSTTMNRLFRMCRSVRLTRIFIQPISPKTNSTPG